MIVITWVCLVNAIVASTIEITPQTVQDEIDIRTNLIIEANEPNFNFNKIYKRQVFEIVGKELKNFTVCSEQPPEVFFNVISIRNITKKKSKPKVIFNFDDLKYYQTDLDTIVHNESIYTMLQNGSLLIYTLNNAHSINHTIHIHVKERLELGHFVQLNSSLLFLNPDYAFVIKDLKVEQILGYENSSLFETVINLSSYKFAVGYGHEGIKIFQYNNIENKINLLKVLNSSAFNLEIINVVDLAFNDKKNLLFILDSSNGVYIYEIFINQSKFNGALQNKVIRKKMCELIYFSSQSDELIMSCRKIYRLKLRDWPIITEQILPHPKIYIREIYLHGNVLLLIGRNIFQVFYLNRPSQNYQDTLTDKIILYNSNSFISSNENIILVGQYVINPPIIMCFLSEQTDSKILGTHQLLFKTTADCNKSYLETIGYAAQNVSFEDKCVYSVYRDAYLWIPGQINLLPIFLFFLLVGVVCLVVMIWIGWAKLKLKKANKQLEQAEGHIYLIEQNQEKNYEKCPESQDNSNPKQYLHDLE